MISIIILGVVALACICLVKETSGGSIPGILICLGIVFCIISCGQAVHIDLLADKEEIKSLQEEIVTIRGCYYGSKTSGTLIGGSIENMQQSQSLSNYVKEYAKKKAAFNGLLQYYKVSKHVTALRLFCIEGFINYKELDKIEKL